MHNRARSSVLSPQSSDSQRLLRILSMHPSRERAVGAADLFQAVYASPCRDKIRDARKLRRLITELRNDGYPICSTSSGDGAGYYLASAGPDLADHCDRIHARAMRLLVMEARLRKGAMPGLFGQMRIG